MEPNDLDKIFREQLEQDTSELIFEELQAKENVWEALDINDEVQATVSPMGSKKWWMLAAALLFLTFGAGTIQMYNKLRTQTVAYNKMEREYEKVANEFNSVKNQLIQLDENMAEQIEKVKNQKTEIIAATPKVETQYIEKTIYVKDTIYSIERIVQAPNVEYIRDTIFVKEQNTEKDNTKPFIASNTNQEQKDKIEAPTKEITKAKKVEFVIGKESIEKPKTNKFHIQVNGSVVARKNN